METKVTEIENKKSGNINTANYVMIAIVVLVLLVSVVQSFQIGTIKNKITANAVKNSGGIDMSDWTENEKMMYEHHGTLPSRLQQNVEASPTMVGGC